MKNQDGSKKICLNPESRELPFHLSTLRSSSQFDYWDRIDDVEHDKFKDSCSFFVFPGEVNHCRNAIWRSLAASMSSGVENLLLLLLLNRSPLRRHQAMEEPLLEGEPGPPSKFYLFLYIFLLLFFNLVNCHVRQPARLVFPITYFVGNGHDNQKFRKHRSQIYGI